MRKLCARCYKPAVKQVTVQNGKRYHESCWKVLEERMKRKKQKKEKLKAFRKARDEYLFGTAASSMAFYAHRPL